MRKYALLTLAALALLGTNLPASAADGDDIKFDVIGEVRARMDYWENAVDYDDDGDDNFSAWPYRVRVGVHGMLTENVAAHVEFQSFGVFGDESPDKGGLFWAGPSTSVNEVGIYQAFIDLPGLIGDNNTIRIGRQEMPYGTELLLGDGDFYNGVAFDGIRFMRSSDKYTLNAFYFKTDEGNAGFIPGSSDSNLFGADFDWKFDNFGSVGAYWFSTQELADGNKIDTIGARWIKMPSADSAFDWNVEYAFQTGDENEPENGPSTDISADVIEGWFGFSFGGSFRNRISVGALMASGDNDVLGGDEEDFQPLFGDVHEGGRLGNLDLFAPTNIESFNVMWSGTLGGGRHMFGAAFHDFTIAEVGAGAEDDLGTEIDLTYDYMPNKVLSFQVGYGMLSGAEVARNDFFTPIPPVPPPVEVDDITRFWAQVRARW